MVDARLFQALSDPTRLDILGLLARGTINVSGIVVHLGCAQPAVSRHLRVLREAALITDRRKGKQVEYSLRPDALAAAAAFLGELVGGSAAGVVETARASGDEAGAAGVAGAEGAVAGGGAVSGGGAKAGEARQMETPAAGAAGKARVPEGVSRLHGTGVGPGGRVRPRLSMAGRTPGRRSKRISKPALQARPAARRAGIGTRAAAGRGRTEAPVDARTTDRADSRPSQPKDFAPAEAEFVIKPKRKSGLDDFLL